MIASKLESLFGDWEEKLSSDEWWFVKARGKLVTSLDAGAAYEEIDGVAEFALRQTDEFLVIECLELLIALARQSQTTELPRFLSQKWDDFGAHVKQYGEYEVSRYQELEQWYRKHAL